MISFVVFGCKIDKYSKYYEKSSEDWETYLSEISNRQEISLNNTVILVLKSSECTPALVELKHWDNLQSNSINTNVKLVIIERYASTFNVFLERENLSIPAYRDSIGIIYSHNLLPTTPMKVLIDANGKVKNIAAIDARENEKEFLFQN